ncbi:MAG: hypothetical protein ACYDGY_04300 [Acidimicrobiales bacterium]
MSDTVPETTKERYREIKRLWDEAAKDDWRGPVKIMPGFEELCDAEHRKWMAEHPEVVTTGPKAPPISRYRFIDRSIES